MKHSEVMACGTPRELYVRPVEDGPKKCPLCLPLKRRRCIKCNNRFQPGCRLLFTCKDCAHDNMKGWNGGEYGTGNAA
jgi:hypothetical protein